MSGDRYTYSAPPRARDGQTSFHITKETKERLAQVHERIVHNYGFDPSRQQMLDIIMKFWLDNNPRAET